MKDELCMFDTNLRERKKINNLWAFELNLNFGKGEFFFFNKYLMFLFVYILGLELWKNI